MRIERASAQDVDGLADVLLDCVAGGASVGFLDTLTQAEAVAWWSGALAQPDTLTWVARDGGRVVGAVRLLLVANPNGTHRAEVAKLLVHRDARGRGCAGKLLDALEEAARELNRTLLILDTHTGSPAEGLYERRGWKRVGTVEDYATTPDGGLIATTFMSIRL
ncbi:GCN5-related N-acetyltransferase [Alloactinosynnema sp. L-07]|uniref:GNAT family N-acetyltransferase n=1 Tax=Alloactinosynnema sp. L-07 TaxID=1653480 RepID=UPI00065F09CB|nr:GNAT family N-acetyltransferase [Alloactinosynnema sp. L-07]CRK58413.1 GCN5-related N-acetyltransferase [Alloactinosynnema sp. L-07]